VTLNKAGIKPFYDERFVDITIDPLAGVPKQYNDIIAYHGKSTKPPITIEPKDIKNIHSHFQELLRPIRVAMIVDQWSKGGAEKEFADMILDANPDKIQYVGIAMNIAWEFYLRNDLKGKMPPFYTHENRGYNTAIDKDYLTLCGSFEEAIQEATKEADVIIKWHTYNMFLENIKKPSILLCNATSWYTETKYKKIYADKYVGNSEWSTKWLPKQATDKLVIYSGHSEERVKPTEGRDNFRKKLGFNENDKVVSHIGRINLDKNLKPLCEAMEMLPAEWKLLLVGRVPIFHKEELDEILKKSLPNRYELVPWIDNVGDAFAASDVFVLSSFYEGFSNALAEAWMSKTPTVFSRCGSANELIERYGNIGMDLPTDASAKEIAEAIIKAPLNVEGIENAYKMIKTFTKEKAARNWERCITEACYNRKTLKVGLLGELKEWTNTLLTNTSRGQIEYKIIDSDKFDADVDVIITWGVKLEPSISKLKIPIIIYATGDSEFLKDNCCFGTDFMSDANSVAFFPKEVRNAVLVVDHNNKLQEFNEAIFVNEWVDCIEKIVSKFEKFHDFSPNYPLIILKLMEKEKTAKRVARKLNMMKFPLPEGEQFWSYVLVNQYLDGHLN